MSSKKKNIKLKKVEKKSSIKLSIYVIIGMLLLLALIYYLIPQGSDKWTVSDKGILSYPENRGKVDVKILKTESGPDYILKNISFPSKDYTCRRTSSHSCCRKKSTRGCDPARSYYPEGRNTNSC